jgi:MoaA/NifB/PqqE/SkfB family radical SAM enzyme
MSLYEKIHWAIRGSEKPREFAYWLLSRPWVVCNPLYDALYRRRIRRRARGFEEFPPLVSVETSALCNADCLYCTRGHMERKLGVMPMELFRGLADEAAGRADMLLSGFGEPLVDKGLEEKVEYAKRAGVEYVSFFTNASLLAPERARALVDAGLDGVDLSIDGASADSFNRVRRGLDFDEVYENVEYLASLRRNGRPFIRLNTLVLPETEDEKELVRKTFGALTDRIVFRRPESWAEQIDLPPEVETPHIERPTACREPCIHLWCQINVYWDGTVPICCRDFDAKVRLGNAADSSIAEIWRAEPLRSYREKHLAKEFDDVPLCNECRYFSIWW